MGERVTVDYCKNPNVIVVRVLDKVKAIEVEDLTYYSMMTKYMDVMKELYEEC